MQPEADVRGITKMGTFLDLIKASAQIWATNPVEFIVAALVGGLVGYFLSRLRHQSTIQALHVRLDHKDDVIKVKDDAIASASASAPRSDPSPAQQRVPIL